MPPLPDLTVRHGEYDILRRAIGEHKPSHVFSMFSGGHDSLCTAHVTSQIPEFSGCVHINTGIGIEETREFVRDTCKKYSWPLIELMPPSKKYEDLIMEHGFPGPAAHRFMYIYLKERAIRQLIRQHKKGLRDRILLVTGVRRQESTRRMGTVQEIQREGCRVWVAPLLDWTAQDIRHYMAEKNIQANPVSDCLHMSGECLCGSFSRPKELEEIAFWYPKTAQHIRDLEARVRAGGKRRCVWGAGNEQRFAKTMRATPQNMPLCRSCVLQEPSGDNL